MDMTSRIKQRMKSLGLKGVEVQAKVEISSGTISNWMNGVSKPSGENLISLAKALNCDPEWLTTGKGESPPGENSNEDARALKSDLVLIEKLDCRASMGTGIERMPEADQSIGTMTISPDWLKSKLVAGVKPENIKLITGIGDSMQGTFESGDVLFVDVSRRTLDVDAIYVISRAGELFIKRVQRLMTGGYRIISDNPKYASQDLTDEGLLDLEVLGRVVGIWGFKAA